MATENGAASLAKAHASTPHHRIESIAPAVHVAASKHQRPPIFHVAIIGAGPRGLSVLERIQAMLSEEHLLHIGLNARINIHLIEPGEPGHGVHSPDAASHQLLNTGAGAVTMWDRADQEYAVGPSLKEWANAHGYRFVDGQFVNNTRAGRAVRDDDYLPRALLGRYLDDVYRTLEKLVDEDSRLRLIRHPLRAVDLRLRPSDLSEDGTQAHPSRVKIVLEQGLPLIVDHVVLTAPPEGSLTAEDSELLERVARCRERNAQLRFVPRPHPLEALQDIAPGAVVAVRGMGRSCLDVIAELTVGRGGRFVGSAAGQPSYRASGREPRIVLYSRSGFALDTRPIDHKGHDEAFEPHFLTRTVIDALRADAMARTGSMQLDLETDVLPRLEQELAYAIHCSSEGASSVDPSRFEPSEQELSTARSLLTAPEPPAFADYQSYAHAFRERLADDVSRAQQGNVNHPFNAAAHVLREIRDVLRYAVDFGGLTPDSHRRFLELAARMDRTAGAVPDRRNRELLALIDAGVVVAGPGPGSDIELDEVAARFVLRSNSLGVAHGMEADVLIHAQLGDITDQPQADSLYANLLESGLIQRYRNGEFAAGGIEIDSRRHVVDGSGNPVTTIDVVGMATEGINWLTNVLPGPGASIRPLVDATQIAANITNHIMRRQPPLASLIAALPETDRPLHAWHPALPEGEFAIHVPTTPSPPALWPRKDISLTFVPGAPAPAELNGIPMRSATPPTDARAWLADSKEDIAIDTPYPFGFASNGRPTAGVVIFEGWPVPRLWLVVPSNGYGGRVTLPQGGADDGELLPVTALRELFEETGMRARLRSVVGDFGLEYDPTPPELRAPTSNDTRFFEGDRIGGSVRDAGWETQALILATYEDALWLLERPRDRAIVRAAWRKWHERHGMTA
jgi:8-oxo-dGTP pyrophosphatase MutT (NUDIX family)/uncharacterized NAD(P)/FAD-binding protein YdhS